MKRNANWMHPIAAYLAARYLGQTWAFFDIDESL